MTKYIPDLPLPPGIENTAQFGDLIGWGRGNAQAHQRAEVITRQEIELIGITLQIAEAWLRYYEGALARNPGNPSVRGRIELMARIMELLR